MPRRKMTKLLLKLLKANLTKFKRRKNKKKRNISMKKNLNYQQRKNNLQYAATLWVKIARSQPRRDKCCCSWSNISGTVGRRKRKNCCTKMSTTRSTSGKVRVKMHKKLQSISKNASKYQPKQKLLQTKLRTNNLDNIKNRPGNQMPLRKKSNKVRDTQLTFSNLKISESSSSEVSSKLSSISCNTPNPKLIKKVYLYRFRQDKIRLEAGQSQLPFRRHFQLFPQL